jgi:hypothetical protein
MNLSMKRHRLRLANSKRGLAYLPGPTAVSISPAVSERSADTDSEFCSASKGKGDLRVALFLLGFSLTVTFAAHPT